MIITRHLPVLLVLPMIASLLAMAGCGGGSGGGGTASAPPTSVSDVTFQIRNENAATVTWKTTAPTTGTKLLFAVQHPVTGGMLFDPATAMTETAAPATDHALTVTNAVIGGVPFKAGEHAVRLHLGNQTLPSASGVVATK